MTEPRQIFPGSHEDADPLSQKGKGPPKMRRPPPGREALLPKHWPTGPKEGELAFGNASEGSSSCSRAMYYGGHQSDLSEVLPAKVKLFEDQSSDGVLAPYPQVEPFLPTPAWDGFGGSNDWRIEDVQFRSREERQLIEQREWELLQQRQKEKERAFLLQCQRERDELNLKQQERYDQLGSQEHFRQHQLQQCRQRDEWDILEAIPPPSRSHLLPGHELPPTLMPASLEPTTLRKSNQNGNFSMSSGMPPGGNGTYQGLGPALPHDGPPSFEATDEDILRRVPLQHQLSLQWQREQRVNEQLQERLLQREPQRVFLQSHNGSPGCSALAQPGVSLASPAMRQPIEQRSTVMLRNLPVGFSRDMLTDLLDRHGFARCYDFVYMPINFRTRVTFGYAFVNFASEQYAKKCKEVFEGFVDWGLRSDRVCEVTWSDMHQGLPMHVERYRNSPVMHESVPDEYKPALYVDGIRVRFPAPTKRIRAPRIRHAAGGGSAGGKDIFDVMDSL